MVTTLKKPIPKAGNAATKKKAATKQSIVNRLIEITRDQFDLRTEKEITKSTSFVDDLGAGSLEVVELVMTVEEVFSIEIPSEHEPDIVTVDKLATYVCNRTESEEREPLHVRTERRLLKNELALDALKEFDIEKSEFWEVLRPWLQGQNVRDVTTVPHIESGKVVSTDIFILTLLEIIRVEITPALCVTSAPIDKIAITHREDFVAETVSLTYQLNGSESTYRFQLGEGVTGTRQFLRRFRARQLRLLGGSR